jgi:hypothetical protein
MLCNGALCFVQLVVGLGVLRSLQYRVTVCAAFQWGQVVMCAGLNRGESTQQADVVLLGTL